MVVADQPRQQWIPPPPLPEFYLPKAKLQQKRVPSSISSGTEVEDNVVFTKEKDAVKVGFESRKGQPIPTGDGAYDGLPPLAGQYRAVPPPYTQNAAWDQTPPLAVYHICRLCHRPRSARYHREHPIPIDGVPPPPSICHRCRVTSVKDTGEIAISDVDEVVFKGESNPIKLGCIAPFVPDEAMISNEEAKRMEAQRYLRGRSRDRHITIFREASTESQRRRRRSKSRRSDIVYRHVRVYEEPEPSKKVEVPRSPERTTRSYTYERRGASRPTYEQLKAAGPLPAARPAVKKAELARVDSVKASVSTQGSSSTSRSSTKVVAKRAPQRPERTDSEIQRIAGEEVRRYARDLQGTERQESDIRRIAHEEVTRYREAERKLEARPGAFAHGRMIPVERRIDAEKDVRIPMPWDTEKSDKASKPASPVAVEANARAVGPELARSMTSSSSRASHSRVQSVAESRGSHMRREVSLERHNSNASRRETWNVEAAAGSRATGSAQPAGGKSHTEYDVIRGSDVTARTSRIDSKTNDDGKSSNATHSKQPSVAVAMSPPSHATIRYSTREDAGREREVVERLSVVKGPASSQRRESEVKSASNRPTVQERWEEAEVVRSATSRSSKVWNTSGSGGASQNGSRSSGRPWERGSEEHAAIMLHRERSLRGGGPPSDQQRKPAGTRQPSNVEYEYKLHTVRPAGPSYKTSSAKEVRGSQRARSPEPVALEVWQQVPVDPVQRAREARMHERERDDAVQWLKTHMDDPATQVGSDADGTRRVACSVYHRGSEGPRLPAPGRERQTPRQCAPPPPRDGSPRRQERSPRPSSHKSHKEDDREWPDRGVVVEVWEQVPKSQGSRLLNDSPPSRASHQDKFAGPPKEDFVVEAWKQVPKDRQSASSGRRDSAVETPPARRRRERRGQPNRTSEDSAHVKFSSKIDISPTPPGSDESSAAFRRFHDFTRRKARQIDGHESDERGEDLIAEYERRGRLRSREPGRRRSEFVYDNRSSRDRDETVKLQEGSRRYDGGRKYGWRPLQRALSESPARELSDRKRSSTKSGPPYHPDERPTDSMTTRDGSQIQRQSPWW